MRELFKGFIKPSEEERNFIWENCHFSFDTNILLGLYRMSEETRKEVIKLMEAMRDRVFLPYQVAREFHENRIGVLSNRVDKNRESIKDFEKLLNSINNKYLPPWISSEIREKLTETFEKFKAEIEIDNDNMKKLISNDEIYNEIASIFTVDKITPKKSREDISELVKKGEIRYEKKIPPGFGDSTKKEVEKKFGDYFIWDQILEYSRQNKVSVMFVTEDSEKGDWYIKAIDSETFGTHPLLVEEFQEENGEWFQAIRFPLFLKIAGEKYSKVNKSSIDEIRHIEEQIRNQESIKKFRRKSEKDFILDNDFNLFQKYWREKNKNYKYNIYNEFIDNFIDPIDTYISTIDNESNLRELELYLIELEKEIILMGGNSPDESYDRLDMKSKTEIKRILHSFRDAALSLNIPWNPPTFT